jgi:hypothetical protein
MGTVRALTQAQVETALARIWLPGQPAGSTPSTPAGLAAAIFRTAEELQPEAERWETGAVYADPGEPGQRYRREAGGWSCMTHDGEHYRDGELVTSEFRRLSFPGGSR